MKRALMILAIALLPTKVAALEKEDIIECGVLAGSAFKAMISRGEGRDSLEWHKMDEWKNEVWTDEVLDMYIEAHSQPIYETEREWTTAAMDFATIVELRCLKERN